MSSFTQTTHERTARGGFLRFRLGGRLGAVDRGDFEVEVLADDGGFSVGTRRLALVVAESSVSDLAAESKMPRLRRNSLRPVLSLGNRMRNNLRLHLPPHAPSDLLVSTFFAHGARRLTLTLRSCSSSFHEMIVVIPSASVVSVGAGSSSRIS